MNEIYEFLKSCGTYYLATLEDGRPRVRPFGTIDLYEGGLYIQTGKVKSVSRQMKADPRIEICGMHKGKWIRLQHMLENYPSLQKMYQPGDGNTEVFRLNNVKAQICSFTEEPRTIEIR